MTTEYTRSVLKMVVAQICQAIGWHSIHSTPLEFMVDLMQEYIVQVSKLSCNYGQVLGRCEANLDDLGLALRHMNIDLQELSDYIKNVESTPCALNVPKLPVPKENHLNFLKPGSREVVTRPMHVHEHLPPMYPDIKDEEYSVQSNEVSSDTQEALNESTETNLINESPIKINDKNLMEDSPSKLSIQSMFKRPIDPISPDSFAHKLKNTDEDRPLREIHSVIMTTQGYLSTAREGKLPEAKGPLPERADTPSPTLVPEIPLEIKVEKKIKKSSKKVVTEKGIPENKENKKKKMPKENLFTPDKDVKIRKGTELKEIPKIKPIKPGTKVVLNDAGPSNIHPVGKIQDKNESVKSKNTHSPKKIKLDIDVRNPQEEVLPKNSYMEMEEPLDKLPSEPDKQKLNIFKKISKVKDDRDKDIIDHANKIKDFCQKDDIQNLVPPYHSEQQLNYRNTDDLKQLHKKSAIPVVNNNIERTHKQGVAIKDSQNIDTEMYMFDDMSPPGTPSTPKTPELNVPSSAIAHKKKRKDKSGKKKDVKIKALKTPSPKKMKITNEVFDTNAIVEPERPKTPEFPETSTTKDCINALPFPFLENFQNPPFIPRAPIFRNNFPNAYSNPPVPSFISQNPRQRWLNPNIQPQYFEHIAPPMFPVRPSMIDSQHQVYDKALLPKTSILPSSPCYSMQSTGAQLPSTSPAVLQTGINIIQEERIKAEKLDKKNKEHKKDKKEKLKKKKEKKEKHKDKEQRLKDKKDKLDKKEKLDKIRDKKEKKEKKKEKEALRKMKEEKIESVPKLTLKLNQTSSPRPATPDSTSINKITIKYPKKIEEEIKREPSPELAKFSALITRPPKPKSSSKKAAEGMIFNSAVSSDSSLYTNRATVSNVSASSKKFYSLSPEVNHTKQSPFCFLDKNGIAVWICPTCKKKDDGSPMIGCDDCDDWYHWPCVKIEVEPPQNVNWYCPACIAKNQNMPNEKKKKRRRKKLKDSV